LRGLPFGGSNAGMGSEDEATPVRAVPVRVALYVLAALSAAAALFIEPAVEGAVRRGALAKHWLFLPISIFALFLVAYAVDRVLLVRRRRYPAGRALFQVAFGVVFAAMLLPSTLRDYQANATSTRPGQGTLLAHPDPEVRATACLAMAFDGPSAEAAGRLIGMLDDPEERVRSAAAAVLGRWSGLPPGELSGIRAWASAISETSTGTREEGRR
jgi:HEAT repeat protein